MRPAWVLMFALSSAATSQPRGLWLTPRKDPTNQARADVRAAMTAAPREVWRMPTGGEVLYAQDVRVNGKPCGFLQVGSMLELSTWRGERLWQRPKLGAGLVLRVEDLNGDGRAEALVRTDVRTIVLIDVASGEVLWSWQSAPSTQIIGHAFLQMPGGWRFYCFPSYSLDGFCFDFGGGAREPKLLWQQTYAGKYDAGFGPNVVLADMDRDGKTDLVVSGKGPSVSQLVLDADTGAVKMEAHHELDGWGRPYGLLHVTDLDADGLPDVVMVCCQVEEYLCVVRNVEGKRLEKLWGRFIEKDWPTDEKELRPQVTSVADLRDNGRPELVVGVFEAGQWRTLVIDPLQGFEAQRAALEGLYFWGCHDLTGDGRPEVIVSHEARRRPSRSTTLVALDGPTLQPVATLDSAAILDSPDSETPPNTYFMALRRNPVPVETADGTVGILVRKLDEEEAAGVFLWGGAPGRGVALHRVAGPGSARVHLHGGGLLFSDARGGVQRFDGRLRPVGRRLTTNGRVCQPLVWEVGGRRELVVDMAGGEVAGGRPEAGALQGMWRVPGSYPALHLDAQGVGRLAAADLSNPDQPTALIYTAPLGPSAEPLRVPLAQPLYARAALLPYGAEYRLLANLQTGVHTFVLATYDSGGSLLWEDRGSGAYPNAAAAGDLDGDGREEVAADDHGVYRVYNAAGKVTATHPGWPPAYNLPIVGPFGPDRKTCVLRSAGINGMALLDAGAQVLWFRGAPVWRYYQSVPAVGDVAGDGRLALGIVSEDGRFECLDTANGEPLWSVDLGTPPSQTSVVAGDVDGDGQDEFLTGLPDGRLVCLGQGRIVWERELDAAVANPILADVEGDGLAEVVVSTADGHVRILK